MSINLEQFHQTFFEESFEGLDSMESGLLSLQGVAAQGCASAAGAGSAGERGAWRGFYSGA